MALAGRTLFTLAPEVEERVVDADGEPDQQHDCTDVLVHRDEVARQREQPERAEHGGEREQQRHACGDDRAEHEHEDEQRQRDGPLAGQLRADPTNILLIALPELIEPASPM